MIALSAGRRPVARLAARSCSHPIDAGPASTSTSASVGGPASWLVGCSYSWCWPRDSRGQEIAIAFPAVPCTTASMRNSMLVPSHVCHAPEPKRTTV
jgi:hypothetical protein